MDDNRVSLAGALEKDTNPPDASVLSMFQSLGKKNVNEASAT